MNQSATRSTVSRVLLRRLLKKQKTKSTEHTSTSTSKKKYNNKQPAKQPAEKSAASSATSQLPPNMYKSREMLTDTGNSDDELAPNNTPSLAITTPAALTNTNVSASGGQVQGPPPTNMRIEAAGASATAPRPCPVNAALHEACATTSICQ
ncbi:hypothetical protein PM082_007052 [Marasmius tenuissimus]|nr:hypothetical protein PM082_007052 [Marasmius tenuissimus]